MEGSFLTICSQCGNLVMMNESTFSDCVSPMKERNSQNPEKYFLKDPKKWPHFNEIINSKALKNAEVPKMPLCPKCLDFIVNDQNAAFSIFSSSIESITKNKNDYKTCADFMSSGVQNDEMPQNFVFNKPKNQMLIQCITEERKPKKCQSKPGSALFYAFFISQDGLYGTINNLRVGYLDQYPVPIEEIQTGLYMIGRCLIAILDLLNIKQNSISVTSSVACFVGDKFVEMKYPSSKKEIPVFNSVLDKFMELFEVAFFTLSKKGVAAPNLIVSVKGTIGGFDYRFYKDDTYNFTNGMRKLLVDIKTVQVLKTFV